MLYFILWQLLCLLMFQFSSSGQCKALSSEELAHAGKHGVVQGDTSAPAWVAVLGFVREEGQTSCILEKDIYELMLTPATQILDSRGFL